MKKIVLYILLVLATPLTLKGAHFSFSQNEPNDGIFSFFSDIASRHPEKLWLHLDKPYYGAGDTIWFRAYLTDAATLRADTLSNFIYVDLFNRKNKLVSSKKIKRDSLGFANNLWIPDSLPAGEYTLRAYTGWMLNFDSSCFFQKSILVGRSTAEINTEVTYTDKEIIIRFRDKSGSPLPGTEASYALFDRNGKQLFSDQQPTSPSGALFIPLPDDIVLNETYAETRLKIRNGTIYKRTFFLEPQVVSFDIQFLPEGGSMIPNELQTIAFKAMQSNGYPTEVNGVILNRAGDTVARFHSEHEGMGSFSLIPQSGEAYQAVTQYGDSSMTTVLAAAQKDACALTVNQNGNNLRYRILGNVPEGSALVAHTRGQCHFIHPVTPDTSEGVIKTDSLPEGILHLLLVDLQGTPRSERLVYLSKPTERCGWSVKADKSAYAKREKVSIDITLEKDGRPLSGNFSVSVTDAAVVKTDSLAENIRSYLLLSSDLKGYIHNPGYYFLDDSPARRHYLDLVMMTHGWRRFKTDNLFTPEPFAPTHYGELGQYISGHVKTLGNKDAKRVDVTALAMNQENMIANATTDSSGYFTMEGLDFQDKTVFIVSSKNKRGRIPYKVSVDTLYPKPTFTALYPFLTEKQQQLRNDDLQNYLKSFPKTSSDGLTEYEIEEVTVTARNPNRPRMSVRGTLYDTTDLIKFKQFPLLHYVSSLPKVMRMGNHLLGRVVGGGWVPMGVTVNGRGVMNIFSLNNFTVDDVEYINSIAPERVEIYLKPGAGIKPDFTIYKTIGYCENVEFYSPVYDTPEKFADKKPDNRTTLYWNPYVTIDPDGKAVIEFYSNDTEKPQYKITIEGVTPQGIPCRYQQKL